MNRYFLRSNMYRSPPSNPCPGVDTPEYLEPVDPEVTIMPQHTPPQVPPQSSSPHHGDNMTRVNGHLRDLTDAMNTLVDNHYITDRRIRRLADSQDPSTSPSRSMGGAVTPHHVKPIPRDLSFSGSYHEDAGQFATKFARYSTYENISAYEMCGLFPVLLSGPALSWFEGLSDEVKDCWDMLNAAFLSKYGPPSRGFLQETALLDSSGP